MSEHNDTALALEVLRGALRLRRPRRGLLHHSDRGSPYASDSYRAELRAAGVRQSMSRKGDCWDNAVAESFFATLRAELVDHERYATRDAAMRSIADYIDNFYNVERRHSHLDYLNHRIRIAIKTSTACGIVTLSTGTGDLQFGKSTRVQPYNFAACSTDRS